jgi:parallel beta-helix repeat protein
MRGKANYIRWLLCTLFVLAVKQTVDASSPPPGWSDSPKAIYVDVDAPGANNGSSWENAYLSLQDALADAAEKKVEIRVAQGVYKPDRRLGTGRFPRMVSSGDRTATFQLINNVIVVGGYAGFGKPYPDERKVYFYETILSGDLSGNDGPNFTNNSENSYHVVKVGGGIDAEALLDGFTITAGNADGPESFGGGMYIDSGGPAVINCTIIGNTAIDDGGGVYCHDSSRPYFIDCIITQNSARNHGGGVFCKSKSTPTISSCTIHENSAEYGGGLYSDRGRLEVTNCTISGNTARQDGGAFYSVGVPSQIESNIVMGNSAQRSGGGIFFDTALRINNNLITDNLAQYGGGIYCLSSSSKMYNNTIVRNLATGYGGGGIYCGDSSPSVVNTILWNNSPDEIYLKESSFTATYSNVQGGWPGVGNINADPLFADADGADGVIGTEDDDLSLLPGSPCNNAGNNSAVPPWLDTDLDGNPRIMNDIVDMGAYEQTDILTVCYVDAINGDDNNDGLTPEKAFATIKKGIDIATDGDVVLVYPGMYQEEVNFLGKAITVQGIAVSPAGVPVLWNPGDFAVSFYYGEGPDSILKNFIIKDSFMSIFIAGSSPTLSNLTIVGNKYGVEAYGDSEPDISNAILWDNADGDLFGCQARYSCIERGSEGEGDISDDPLFVDPDNDDYHIRSERGRYWPEHDVWVLDKVTSPCVDGGDPHVDTLDEPIPHGGRINIGAYGGTPEASLSPSAQPSPLPLKASNPYPADGADYIEGRVISWTAGLNAVLHDVYFSSNEEAVADGDISNRTGTYRGRQAAPSYTPFDGFWSWPDPSVYWRIDEVDREGNITKGDVWTFSIIPPPSRTPPKGRACFTAETEVWIDGNLIPISKAVQGHINCGVNSLGKVQEVQEHSGTFTCYDVLLESGNCISVAENHFFLSESGQWLSLLNLKAGIKLQTPKGSIGITSITKRPTPYTGKVYNLKVAGSDRYLVGRDAVIVRDY